MSDDDDKCYTTDHQAEKEATVEEIGTGMTRNGTLRSKRRRKKNRRDVESTIVMIVIVMIRRKKSAMVYRMQLKKLFQVSLRCTQ